MTTKRPAKPKPPADLGAAGRALWVDVFAKYELRPDEVRVLAHACRVEDTCARIAADLVDAPLLTKGSTGQDVAHPLLAELRQQQAVLARLLRQLGLPDEDERRAGARSARAREAAMVRWSA